MSEENHTDILVAIKGLNSHFEEPHGIIPKMDKKVEKTNGRVKLLEKFMWSVGGGFVIIMIFVVPLFMDMLKEKKTDDLTQRLKVLEAYFDDAEIEIIDILEIK